MRFSVIRGRFDKITVRALFFVPVQPFLPFTPLPDANLCFRYLWARTGPTSHQQSRPGHWSVILWCANSGDIVAEQPFLICSQFKIGTRPFRPVRAIESQNPPFLSLHRKKASSRQSRHHQAMQPSSLSSTSGQRHLGGHAFSPHKRRQPGCIMHEHGCRYIYRGGRWCRSLHRSHCSLTDSMLLETQSHLHGVIRDLLRLADDDT